MVCHVHGKIYGYLLLIRINHCLSFEEKVLRKGTKTLLHYLQRSEHQLLSIVKCVFLLLHRH